MENFHKLDRESFKPDPTFETIFPWKDVLDSFDFTLPIENNGIPCPKCGLKTEKLIWIEFSSPRWTWEKMCGRLGPLSICPTCKIQVEFICGIMN